jgi:hypothetical protein
MLKMKISSPDLTALFAERLPECPDGFMIAIVPTDFNEAGWSAVMNWGQRSRHPKCARRVQAIEKQLRQIYDLAKD